MIWCSSSAARHDGMSGLIMHGMISWATRKKRPCMIDADHVPTAHVKGKLILDKLVHDTIITACAHSEARMVASTCDGWRQVETVY